MKYLIIILTACAICMGCKKNRTAVVKGRVINPITNEGFEGFEVWLQRTTSGSIGTTGGFETIEKTTTDANGYFEIEGKGSGGLNIRCVDENNYSIGWYQNGEKVNSSTQTMSVSKGEETYAEYHSVPYKNVVINVKNVNCEGSTDSAYVQSKYQFDLPFEYGAIGVVPLEGCLDETFSSEMASGNYYYKYTVKRPSGTSISYDTIFVNPNGNSSTLLIEY